MSYYQTINCKKHINLSFYQNKLHLQGSIIMVRLFRKIFFDEQAFEIETFNPMNNH